MSGRNPLAGCSRNFAIGTGGDITSRDIILDVFSDDNFNIGSTTGVLSTYQRDSGIAMFDLTESMAGPHDLVAFSVTRDVLLIGEADPVPFNIHFVNVGGHYNTFSHRFLAPTGGIYFICISTGLFSGASVNLELFVREEPFIDLNRRSTHHSDSDIISRCILLPLGQNDEVHVVNPDGEAAWSSNLMEMSFSGFKYEPAFGSSTVWFDISISDNKNHY